MRAPVKSPFVWLQMESVVVVIIIIIIIIIIFLNIIITDSQPLNM